jgi:hypothetical protein
MLASGSINPGPQPEKQTLPLDLESLQRNKARNRIFGRRPPSLNAFSGTALKSAAAVCFDDDSHEHPQLEQHKRLP